jgi:uncharacterized protein (TIRG00374 family)
VSISARLRLGVGVALALALLFFFFKDMDWPALGRALRTADPLFLAGVVLAAILTYTLRAWRWGYLLAPMARVPFLDLFSATTVGFMTGLVIPRAGEIVRPYLVAQRHGVTTSAGVATIILERLFDLLTVLLLFGLYLFVLPAPAAQSHGPVMEVVKAAGAFVALAALVLLALLVVFHARADEALAFFDRLLRLFPQWLARWAGGVLRAFAGGLAVLKAPLPHLLAIVAQSFLVWLSIAASIWFNNRAFGIGLPFHATFLIIAFLTVGVAIPTPGMVGGFHGFFVLATADVFGVHREVAGAAAIACHALSNLPVLVLGLAFLGREGLSLGRVAEMTERKDAGTIPATEGSR